MSSSVGLVVPAYRPDVPRLRRYVGSLWDAVEPAAIRIELDDPGGDVRDRLAGVDADLSVADHRRGKGLAITSGFEALGTDVRAFVDADGATAPASVDALVEPIRRGDAALSVGSRRLPGATVSGRSAGRRAMSAAFAGVASRVSGIGLSDFQCGAKAVSADCWRDVRGGLCEAGFGWDLEVLWLAHRRGHAVVEVPISWTETPGSTVPPVRTAAGLGGLLGRVLVARMRGHDRVHPGRTPLLARLPPDGGASA